MGRGRVEERRLGELRVREARLGTAPAGANGDAASPTSDGHSDTDSAITYSNTGRSSNAYARKRADSNSYRPGRTWRCR